MKYLLVLCVILPYVLAVVPRAEESAEYGHMKKITATQLKGAPRKLTYAPEVYERILSDLERNSPHWIHNPKKGQMVPPRSIAANHFDFNFVTSFPAEASNCFEVAGQLLSIHLDLTQKVVVDASWSPAAPGNLGSAGSNYLHLSGGEWRVDALENERIGGNANSAADIKANFNSAFCCWSYSTNGSTSTGEYDLVSVILHELCHGMGFLGLDYDSGSGICHYNPSTGTCYGPNPISMEQNLRSNAHGLVTGLFAAGSQSTYESVYTGNNDLFYDFTNCGLTGSSDPIFTPTTYLSGSSGSHWNETSFAQGTPAALMTPYLNDGEVIHHPGGNTLDVFRCMGYNLNDCTSYTDASTCLDSYCSWCSADNHCGDQYAYDRPNSEFAWYCNGTWNETFVATPSSAIGLSNWVNLLFAIEF
jgi:hypothetical protein